jgi:DMSO/TMAO reductase YedYZ molybdopterin-dependent catalytic subunit
MKLQRNIVLALVMISVWILPGCRQDPAQLDPQEITSYKGIDLTPAGSLRENSIKGIQSIAVEDYSLKIGGRVANPLVLSYEDVLNHKNYTKVVTLHCVEGWNATILWEGVLIEDLLAKSAVEEDGVTVIFHAEDGYTTSLPLKTIVEKKILLAYKANGQILPENLGFPFIVVAEDKLGYKWARWVTEMEISDNPNYSGYWELRGYTNSGDILD